IYLDSSKSQVYEQQRQALINAGKAHYDHGDFEEALAVFEKTIHFDPDYKEAYAEKGRTLDKLLRHKEARAAFRSASNIASPSQSIQSIEQKTTWLYKEPFRYDL